MNASSFNTCYNSNCSAPYGSCTAVANGSAYDQFDAFRNLSYAPAFSSLSGISCTYINNVMIVYLYNSTTPSLFQRHVCSWLPTTTLTFNMRLNATTYALAYGYPHANVTAASVNQSGNGNASVSIAVQNIGPVAGGFGIVTNSCCYTNTTGSYCQGSQGVPMTPLSTIGNNVTIPSMALGTLLATLGTKILPISQCSCEVASNDDTVCNCV